LTDFLTAAVQASGLSSLLLGIAHLFFPILFDFDTAIPRTGSPLRLLDLGVMRYRMTRRDVWGIAWVMNMAASYVLISVGLASMLLLPALPREWAVLLAWWIAFWWLIRAASQLFLGHRPGDILILIGFAIFGFLHIAWALT
jgi:hypothetical protein